MRVITNARENEPPSRFKNSKTRHSRLSVRRRACHSAVQPWPVVQRGHRIGRSVTPPNREAGADGRGGEILSRSNAF